MCLGFVCMFSEPGIIKSRTPYKCSALSYTPPPPALLSTKERLLLPSKRKKAKNLCPDTSMRQIIIVTQHTQNILKITVREFSNGQSMIQPLASICIRKWRAGDKTTSV